MHEFLTSCNEKRILPAFVAWRPSRTEFSRTDSWTKSSLQNNWKSIKLAVFYEHPQKKLWKSDSVGGEKTERIEGRFENRSEWAQQFWKSKNAERKTERKSTKIKKWESNPVKVLNVGGLTLRNTLQQHWRNQWDRNDEKITDGLTKEAWNIFYTSLSSIFDGKECVKIWKGLSG